MTVIPRKPLLDHGFYNRWLLISLCAHMEQIRHFALLKAFGYIEKVVKSDIFFSEKTYFTSYVRIVKWATIQYKNHAINMGFQVPWLDGEWILRMAYCRNISSIILITFHLSRYHRMPWGNQIFYFPSRAEIMFRLTMYLNEHDLSAKSK